MVRDDLKDEIKLMLQQGMTYREIAEALNVSFTTIRKVKKELELEEAIQRFSDQLKQYWPELRRVWKDLERREALPTEDKLANLWSLWSMWEKDVEFSLLLDKSLGVFTHGLMSWLSAYLQLFNILVTLVTPVIPPVYAMGGYGEYPPVLLGGGSYIE